MSINSSSESIKSSVITEVTCNTNKIKYKNCIVLSLSIKEANRRFHEFMNEHTLLKVKVINKWFVSCARVVHVASSDQYIL